MNIDWRLPLIKDNFWLKTTFDGIWLLTEVVFDGRKANTWRETFLNVKRNRTQLKYIVSYEKGGLQDEAELGQAKTSLS